LRKDALKGVVKSRGGGDIRGIGQPILKRHLQEGCPIDKERDNLLVISLKHLNVKIRIKEATAIFKNYQMFIL
jgi:hypothetical protein